jgi:hypothetical protein
MLMPNAILENDAIFENFAFIIYPVVCGFGAGPLCRLKLPTGVCSCHRPESFGVVENIYFRQVTNFAAA